MTDWIIHWALTVVGYGVFGYFLFASIAAGNPALVGLCLAALVMQTWFMLFSLRELTSKDVE